MSQHQGGGRGPQPDDDKKPARQTEDTAAKQRSGHEPKQRWDISQGAEPSTAGSARRRG
jgi:hypothetical protein